MDAETQDTAGLTEYESKWIEDLDRLVKFFTAHPEMIPEHAGVTVYGPHFHRVEATRAQAKSLAELAGPLEVTPMRSDANFVDLTTTGFGQHKIRLYVQRESIGRKVAEAVPDVWEYDDGIIAGGQS